MNGAYPLGFREEASGQPCVVVGYDGSAEAETAVAHAIDRAGPGGHTVVVHAFPQPSDRLRLAHYGHALAEARRRGQAVLDALVMEDTALLDADVDTELVGGTPAEAIMAVARSCGADEIVVGSRGLGTAAALLGSVSHDLVRRADRPVVVVPRQKAHR